MTRPASRHGAAICIVLGVAACAIGTSVDPISQPVLRPASQVPAAFVLNDGTAGEASGACRNPLYDPADRTSVRLIRSGGGHGDYEVPDGMYGVGPGELLRLECGSGRPLGIVRR